MDHQDLHKLVEPMPAWMHAVIKPKGGHINATVSHSEIHLHDVLFIVTFSFKLIIEHPKNTHQYFTTDPRLLESLLY